MTTSQGDDMDRHTSDTGSRAPEAAHVVLLLSDYLNGDLHAGDAARVDAHLAGCSECRTVLDELRTVVARARALPVLDPPDGLWERIRDDVGLDPDVIPIATGGEPARPLRGLRLSVSQMAAAAVALIGLSAAATLGMIRALAEPAAVVPIAEVAGVGAETEGSLDRAARLDSRFAGRVPVTLATELMDLERRVEEGRDDLDPTTVRILEKNMAVIDRAIRESLEALTGDPGNAFLEGHLEAAVERKVRFLRDAAGLSVASD